MSKQIHKFTFRTDAIVLEKLRCIADSNFRTINKELEMLTSRYIAEYEHTHGVILLHDVKDSDDPES